METKQCVILVFILIIISTWFDSNFIYLYMCVYDMFYIINQMVYSISCIGREREREREWLSWFIDFNWCKFRFNVWHEQCSKGAKHFFFKYDMYIYFDAKADCVISFILQNFEFWIFFQILFSFSIEIKGNWSGIPKFKCALGSLDLFYFIFKYFMRVFFNISKAWSECFHYKILEYKFIGPPAKNRKKSDEFQKFYLNFF